MTTSHLCVIKIGTNLLTREDFSLDEEFISRIAAQILELKKNRWNIVLVSSGAMAAGRSELILKKESKNIPLKQALCAVGQGILINKYRELFKPHGLPVAQVLLTDLDFKIKKNFLTTRNTLNLLLELGALPIINENDVVSFEEIKFGDNDILSAKVASMLGADLLLLLTDVEGFFDKNPATNPNAKLISRVENIDENIKKMAGDKISKKSLGGMKSKIIAAQYAVNSAVPVIITHGRTPDILSKIFLQKIPIGTHFTTHLSPLENQKKWLLPQVKKNTFIIIDSGAAEALKIHKKSLLPAGVKEISGEFERGDVIKICAPDECLIGYGMSNYGSSQLKQIKGLPTEKIAEIMGMTQEPEAINRDNMIIL